MGLKMKTPIKKRALAPERKLPLQYAVDMAGPVAVLAFSLHGTVAVLKAREGDYGYAAILTPLMLVLCAFLWQARKTYMVTQETIKRSRERDAEKEEQHVS